MGGPRTRAGALVPWDVVWEIDWVVEDSAVI